MSFKARSIKRGRIIQSRGYDFTVVLITADGDKQTHEIKGWRATVEKAKTLRQQHPQARSLYAIATF